MSTSENADLFAGPGEAPADRVYTVRGGDWERIGEQQSERAEETLVVNMGPQHPATHGVLRLILETEGETVKSIRPGIGFLHTGIEKNMEYRTWSQGSAFVTRMDYVAPLFNEVVYCLAVEKLMGITDQIPERATIIRVLMMELNRISNHLVAIGTTGNELGATTVMMSGFREREIILDFFEAVTGLRMNHAYVRPGGVAVDLPETGLSQLRETIAWLEKYMPEMSLLVQENPIFHGRTMDVGVQDLTACMAMGVTGPILRSTGYAFDLRKAQPYCGYETYDFDVATWDTSDCYGRYRVRLAELWESLKIVKQCVGRLEATAGQPVMFTDPRFGTPADLTVGPDGQGNSHEHVKHIMGESMEALIHHFKVVTEGFRVPAGQAYVAIESPKGELGCHVVSDGTTRPFRVHMRDPGFNHLQSVPLMCEGGMISDVIMAVASIDPVMGGVDR